MSELKARTVHSIAMEEKDLEISGTTLVYLKSDVDAAITELKDKCQMHDFFWEGCGFAKRGFKNTIAVSEAFDRLEAENADLEQKLEDVKATAYADSVDADMRERRLKRTLWITRTATAKSEKDRWNAHIDCGNRRNRKDPAYVKTGKLLESSEWRKLWADIERKCMAKAEEYK